MPSTITPSVSLEVIAISLIKEESEMYRLEEVVSVLSQREITIIETKIKNIEK
jgi:hypothetical protein